MKIESYNYDGIVKIRCARCGIMYEIAFNGNEQIPIVKAIKNALIENNWNIEDAVCGFCNNKPVDYIDMELPMSTILDDVDEIEKLEEIEYGENEKDLENEEDDLECDYDIDDFLYWEEKE